MRSKPPTNDRIDALPPAPTGDALEGPRADLARVIPRRPRVTWILGIALAAIFAVLVMPAITAERWLDSMGVGKIVRGEPAPLTVRVPPFAGYDTAMGHTGGGGVLIAKGEIADRDAASDAGELSHAQPHGATPFIAFLLLVGVLAGLFTHHTRRSTQGRLLRVQLVSLALIVATAVLVKIVMLTTALSILVVPVAVFAMVPTLVLDRVVGLATGTLAALVVAFLVPFDVGVAVMLMVQAGAAGLMIDERPKRRLRAILLAGGTATLFTAATYPLMLYLSAGRLPLGELTDPLHSAWLASALGPAIATAAAVVLTPLYQLAVGEITQQKLVELEDLSHPLLKQIANRAPGTWQHSLTMANMAEIAANAIGANGRLVRVGAYFHDLGKSLNPKYFIENLEPGETSPHDKLPPETSCDAIFRHVTEGIVAARRAGLHERIIDFMHMHHGNGVLEYFWARCREQGNPRKLTVEHFRYPGVPPQSRETAILSICDAVEAAARTLKKPETAAIDNLVQRIVYGKLHVGQLDESGLSMADLRRLNESLRDTIRHANHGRIEYPWQKAQQDASAQPGHEKLTQTGPRLDSLDRPARPDSVAAPNVRMSAEALAETDSAGATPKLRPQPQDSNELAIRTTAPVRPDVSGARTRGAVSTPRDAAVAQAWKSEATRPGADLSADIPLPLSGPMPTDHDVTRPAPLQDLDATVPAPKLEQSDIIELLDTKPRGNEPPKPPSLRDLAAKPTTVEPKPEESDPRLRRITNPVGERVQSPETNEFVTDAKRALKDASKDMAALPRTQSTTQPVHESAIVSERPSFDSSPVIEIIANEPDISLGPPVDDAPAARKRAATLPPIKPGTVPPPIGRRAPTVPPTPRGVEPSSPRGFEPQSPRGFDLSQSPEPPPRPSAEPLPSPPPRGSAEPPPSPSARSSAEPPPRPPTRSSAEPPNLTAPPPGVLRPPAQSRTPEGAVTTPQRTSPLAGATAPPPSTVRPPGMNYLDDMITLRPQYEQKPDLIVKQNEDGSMLIEPAKSDDGGETQPRMNAIGDTTEPDVPLPDEGARLGAESSWARGLAARLDQQLEEDFGTETPIVAPTRAELQALLNTPPDPTRRQSIEEIEKLHLESRAGQSQELDLERRRPFPTSEVDEADIEAAIELAPPARRNAIGIAKKKRED
ncbi:MAG TPA: HDIG domain-containing metalloprotein [Kofleriaceae bacterium]